MRSLCSILRSRRGETMVEVLVSMVLFLMLFAVMLGAVRFASNAQVQAETIRQRATALQRDLRRQTPTGGDSKTYQFVAVSEDGGTTGSRVFQVPLRKQTVTARGGGDEVTFYLYGPEKGGTGG